MKKITIVIDMQNDFITGSLANSDAANIVPSIREEICYNSDVVIYTRDTHGDNYFETQEGKNLPVQHCIKDTWGWEIVDELNIKNLIIDGILSEKQSFEFYIVDKPTFGCVDIWKKDFFTKLINENEQNVEITFCGTCTDICVISNAIIVKSLYPEIVVNVKADACAGLTPDKHKAALNVMDSCQINII